VGDRWGDSRVVGAAEIADALLPVWEKMKLKTIQPCSPEKNNQTASIASAKTPRLGEYQFAVLSQGGLTILWGPSPAVNLPGEPSRERKLHKLEQFYGEHGSLDYSERPPVLDLRIP
jgi:hypothetical protein